MVHASEINFRDPFVVPVQEERRYYLYGTTGSTCWGGAVNGFDAYSSVDLQEWDGPYAAFRPAPDFWSDHNFWAPEVHRYQGRYFMFASFKAQGVCRGTQILVSDSPRGPFVPHSDGPLTPADWECLDGTLFVDPAGSPWMVFCHEWVQIHDGEMRAMRLTPDLKAAAGDPILLFHASEAPWSDCVSPDKPGDFVTDGPFMYKARNGELLMLWSTLGRNGSYTMGVARSSNGWITAKWTQDPEPLFATDGGHGMVFHTFEGELMLTLHTPNSTPNERPIFLHVEENDGHLTAIR
jgi:beta-xylosidase